MTLSTTFTIPSVEGEHSLPPNAVDPLTDKTVQKLYEGAEGILFLALVSANPNPKTHADFTYIEGKRFWHYVKENTPGDLLVPGTADKVQRFFFYHIDTPRLRSQKWTPEVRFMCDSKRLTERTIASLHETFRERLPPAFFELDYERKGKKTLTEAVQTMRSGQDDFEESPFTFADLILAEGAERIMTDNIVSIAPAFWFEERNKDPVAFYAKQNLEARDLTNEMLQLYAAASLVSGVRLITDPEHFKDVPVNPDFLVSQGIFYALLCIERGITIEWDEKIVDVGGEILREVLTIDYEFNKKGNGLANFKPEDHTALAFFKDCDDVTSAIVEFLESQETITAPMAVLLGLGYWGEAPLVMETDIQKAADYLALAADQGDLEGLYFVANLDLEQYTIDPDPEYLSNFWVSVEEIARKLREEESDINDLAAKGLSKLLTLFEKTPKNHWPEGATDKALNNLEKLIASFEEETSFDEEETSSDEE